MHYLRSRESLELFVNSNKGDEARLLFPSGAEVTIEAGY